MNYTYLIQSEKNGFLYIGQTENLKQRLIDHNNRRSLAAKRHVPFKLVYFEAFSSKQDALDREKKLKHHGSSIGHLKKRIKRSLT